MRDVELAARAGSPPRPEHLAGAHRRWPWILAVVVIGGFLGIGLTGRPGGTTETVAEPFDAPAPSASHVRYEVTGSAARALVTYGPRGGLSQENGVGLPWTRSAPPGGDVGVYSLTAQSSSQGAGRITCRITVDGEVIAEQTSSARVSVASCVGSASGS